MAKISMIIPTYEMRGRGREYLLYNLVSIHKQTFNDYEIIVSDHSEDNEIMNLCRCFSHVRYFRNKKNRGNPSANLNHGISKARGRIIKPLFQDDCFFDDDALAIFNQHFEAGNKWVVCAWNVSFDHQTYCYPAEPKWSDDMLVGGNTLSSPSCMAYENNGEVWNENLTWLLDCEFYYRLHQKYNLPYLENKILVTNFGHDNQLTNLLTEEQKNKDIEFVTQMYHYGES